MSKPARDRWELNREALETLLAALGGDREAASLRYEALRRKLIDYFSWQRCSLAEHLADETLNRLARRLYEGEPVQGLDHYAIGIARLVLREDERARVTKERALREFVPAGADQREAEIMRRAMAECLNQLPAESRKLIRRYYSEDKVALAASLGTSVNALRNRAMRIRARLQECVMHRRDEW